MSNNADERELKKIISEFIKDQLNISFNVDTSLGEKLDSLNRLALIEFLSDKYAIDLSEILIDPKVWASFETMAKSTINVIKESNTNNA